MVSVVATILIFGLNSCKKDCKPVTQACTETVPTNEACQAYFTRWFFNKDKNKCDQIGYSGCSQKGFATQQECEACKCD